jgi:hypothetical protein
MKQHKWAKEIKAWADGAEVQYKDGKDWCDVEEPFWNAKGAEYRIKPQHKEPQYLYVYKINGVVRMVENCGYSYIEVHHKDDHVSFIGKIKLESEE